MFERSVKSGQMVMVLSRDGVYRECTTLQVTSVELRGDEIDIAYHDHTPISVPIKEDLDFLLSLRVGDDDTWVRFKFSESGGQLFAEPTVVMPDNEVFDDEITFTYEVK